MAVPPNTFTSYQAKGNRERLSDGIIRDYGPRGNPPLPALILSTASGRIITGTVDGDSIVFAPPTFIETVHSTQNAQINFSVSGPSWLDILPSSGTATSTPLNITFTVNASASLLSAGTHEGMILFHNNTFDLPDSIIPVTIIVPFIIPLPAGALGVWYAYHATTVNGNLVVPNDVAATPPSGNLIRAPRRQFATATWYRLDSGTIVDENAVDADGHMLASTLTATGNWNFRLRDPVTPTNFPAIDAGTYTIVLVCKRGAGSDQSFKFSINNVASSTKTATASYQRLSHTFTVGAGAAGLSLVSFDSASDATLIISSLEMYAGSSDLGPDTLAGHMYLGVNGFSSVAQPTTGGGYVDFSTGGIGWTQLNSP